MRRENEDHLRCWRRSPALSRVSASADGTSNAPSLTPAAQNRPGAADVGFVDCAGLTRLDRLRRDKAPRGALDIDERHATNAGKLLA
jgi:hypothetical protein